MNKLTVQAFSAAVSLTLLSALPVTTASADELQVPVTSQTDRSATVSYPASGQSQERVRAKFGSPQNVRGPVGDPPITQWDYPGYVVYFEYDKVIHTVLKPSR